MTAPTPHLDPDTFFDVDFGLDAVIARLRPFIVEVHRGVLAGGALRPAVLRAADRHPSLAPFFVIDDGSIDETFGLREEYLFPEGPAIDRLVIANRRTRRRSAFDRDDLAVVERCLSLCGLGTASEAALRDEIDDTLVDVLFRDGHLQTREPPTRLPLDARPGITRLQHASLLYRSETTGILVDPHFHSSYAPAAVGDTWVARDVRDLVDAILISHAHGDHFSPATLMLFPRDLPIIVPRVPRASIIGIDMAAELRNLGFTRVLEPAWYAPSVKIGDFEIDVLPFYGEQPLRDEPPRHRDLRNWGNTYYLRSPQYSSWFLIDSGDDATGRMAEVAEHVASRLGGVDHLLGNLNIFGVGAGDASPDYITGLGHYWLSLQPSQLSRFSSLAGQPITLGPRGVAEVARVCRPKTFLPYAHWWSAIGTQPSGEARRLDELARAADDFGVRMEIVPWRVGEAFRVGGT